MSAFQKGMIALAPQKRAYFPTFGRWLIHYITLTPFHHTITNWRVTPGVTITLHVRVGSQVEGSGRHQTVRIG